MLPREDNRLNSPSSKDNTIAFNQNELLKAIINFCSINDIKLDKKNNRRKKYKICLR